MKSQSNLPARLCIAAFAMFWLTTGSALAATDKPNIMFIMGDDIGLMNVGAYHRGWMVGETPNIDRIAQEGAMFTDYSAMQSIHSSGHPSD
jgi:arylsulfatase